MFHLSEAAFEFVSFLPILSISVQKGFFKNRNYFLIKCFHSKIKFDIKYVRLHHYGIVFRPRALANTIVIKFHILLNPFVTGISASTISSYAI